MKPNVKIKLERDLFWSEGISKDRYTIFVDGKKRNTGYIDPYYYDVKTHLTYHKTYAEQLDEIKKLYHWLF